MNPEHYERVRRAVERTGAAAKAASSGRDMSRVQDRMAQSDDQTRAGQRAWSEAFAGFEDFPLDLSGSDFSGFLFAGGRDQLKGANFAGACLDRSNWWGAVLIGANLAGASLRSSAFGVPYSTQGCSFRGADLTGAISSLCENDSTDFTDADLSGATLRFAEGGTGTYTLTGANLTGATVERGGFSDTPPSVVGPFLRALTAQQREQLAQPKPGQATSRCFIATAAMGSESVGEVLVLRAFRDRCLTRHPVGRVLVRAYECCSPPLAALISGSPALRWLARSLVVQPAAGLARRYRYLGVGEGVCPRLATHRRILVGGTNHAWGGLRRLHKLQVRGPGVGH